jgi:hypothetical protein
MVSERILQFSDDESISDMLMNRSRRPGLKTVPSSLGSTHPFIESEKSKSVILEVMFRDELLERIKSKIDVPYVSQTIRGSSGRCGKDFFSTETVYVLRIRNSLENGFRVPPPDGPDLSTGGSFLSKWPHAREFSDAKGIRVMLVNFNFNEAGRIEFWKRSRKAVFSCYETRKTQFESQINREGFILN